MNEIIERQKIMARNFTDEELIRYARQVGTVMERELASRLETELNEKKGSSNEKAIRG